MDIKVKKYISVVAIGVVFSTVLVTKAVKAENLVEKSDMMATSLITGENVEDYDLNGDNVFNVVDIAVQSSEFNKIDIYYIDKNYVTIAKPKEIEDFKDMGINLLTDKAFVIDEKGVNLYEYVNGGEGISVEFIEGDDSFEIIDNKIMLKGEAPALAKIRLKNAYGVSEDFYIYGTRDKEMSSYLYDYLLYLSEN